MLLAVATLERDNSVAGFEEAKRRANARGAYVARTPWGFERLPDGTISPHPERAAIVAEAFRLAATDSLAAAALRYLKRAAPQRHWDTTRARRLLAQRVYLGDSGEDEHGNRWVREAVVTRAIFEAAQSSPEHREPAAEFPLSGLAICGHCGARMVGGRGGTGQRVYRCSASLSRHRGERCSRGCVITAERLEVYARDWAGQLLAGLRAVITDPGADVLAELERAMLDAEEELDAFAANTTLRKGAR